MLHTPRKAGSAHARSMGCIPRLLVSGDVTAYSRSLYVRLFWAPESRTCHSTFLRRAREQWMRQTIWMKLRVHFPWVLLAHECSAHFWSETVQCIASRLILLAGLNPRLNTQTLLSALSCANNYRLGSSGVLSKSNHMCHVHVFLCRIAHAQQPADSY